MVIVIIAQGITHNLGRSPDNLFKEGVRKVTYEEHEYLIYNENGVCHYPECKCKTKGETK
jgi:hypothetical protein